MSTIPTIKPPRYWIGSQNYPIVYRHDGISGMYLDRKTPAPAYFEYGMPVNPNKHKECTLDDAIAHVGFTRESWPWPEDVKPKRKRVPRVKQEKFTKLITNPGVDGHKDGETLKIRKVEFISEGIRVEFWHNNDWSEGIWYWSMIKSLSRA